MLKNTRTILFPTGRLYERKIIKTKYKNQPDHLSLLHIAFFWLRRFLEIIIFILLNNQLNYLLLLLDRGWRVHIRRHPPIALLGLTLLGQAGWRVLQSIDTILHNDYYVSKLSQYQEKCKGHIMDYKQLQRAYISNIIDDEFAETQ